jgi:hypothetical protein
VVREVGEHRQGLPGPRPEVREAVDWEPRLVEGPSQGLYRLWPAQAVMPLGLSRARAEGKRQRHSRQTADAVHSPASGVGGCTGASEGDNSADAELSFKLS